MLVMLTGYDRGTTELSNAVLHMEQDTLTAPIYQYRVLNVIFSYYFSYSCTYLTSQKGDRDQVVGGAVPTVYVIGNLHRFVST